MRILCELCFKSIISIFLFTVGLYSVCSAQSTEQTHFGTVPDSLFNESRYPANPEVPFIYSLKKLDITFEEANGSIVAVMTYRVRAKIFDASIPQASIVGIPYYFKNDIEEVAYIRGITYQSPDESTKLSPENIRTINLNGRYNLKEFTMPNVEDGSVIEYTYQIKRRYIEELPAFYLANQVPTVLAKVSITYPQYLRYKPVIEDFSHSIDHEEVKIPQIEEPKIFTNPQPDPVIKEVWMARNIPAVRKEKFISTPDDYRGKIKFQLSEFGIPRQPLENSWDYVIEEIRQKQSIFETIQSNKKAFKIGESIRKSVESKKAAQDSIFQYLLKKINYNGRRAPFSSASGAAVLSGEASNQAAINQTLIAMLRGAGIQAWPLLISTRKSGKINKGYPSFFQFNGQLAFSKINDQTYFMDASFAYSQPNLIPVETYNQNGLLLKKNNYRWLELDPSKSVFSIQIKMDAQLQQNGTLSGHIQTAYVGYPARKIRQKRLNGMTIARIIKSSIFDSYSNISVSNETISHLMDYNHPIQINTKFTIPNYAVNFTEGLQFRPMVVGYLMSNPFSKSPRELPVTLDAPEKLDLIYSIKLPKGYELAQTPQDRTLKLPGAVIREQYDIEDDTLHYEFHINISKKQFSPDLYPRLVNLYERWVQLSNSRWFVE